MSDENRPYQRENPRQVRNDAARKRREQHLADLRWLLGHESGRRIAHHYLEVAGLWRTSFSGEALSSAFQEGQRNLGLRLFADLAEAAPERIPALITTKESAHGRTASRDE
jgi:hypothetical protein